MPKLSNSKENVMNIVQLIGELSHALGIELKLSDAGTCGVFFDEDEIFFERHENQLYLIAVLGPDIGRGDAYRRMLEANYLGHECGQCTIGLDANRREFVLHRVLDGEMGYPEFEKILTVFVQVVRYWKRWLEQPIKEAQSAASHFPDGGMMA